MYIDPFGVYRPIWCLLGWSTRVSGNCYSAI